MNDSETPLPPPRNLGMRAVQTVVLLIALYIAMWLLCILSIVQLFAVAINGHPNEQLRTFGSQLGAYMDQIGAVGSFTSDELPFPFGDWPAQS